MKKNQNGVTLIALVVTIVVMLILAATALAMLNGDSGILRNAQRAKGANTEATVVDIMDTTYNAIKTEATVKIATSTGYRPMEKATELLAMVKTEIGEGVQDLGTVTNGTVPTDLSSTTNISSTNGYFVYLENGPITAPATTPAYIDIVMVYRDSTFDLAALTTATTKTYPDDNQYPQLVGRIRLTTSNVTYVKPVRSTLD